MIKMNMKKSLLSAAVAATLSAAVATSAQADTLQMSFDGLFTMVNAAGAPNQNTSYPYYGDTTWGYGLRTPISGTMEFDTVTGAGTGIVGSFEFFGAGPAIPHDITFQAVGDGAGGPGPFLIGNMLFDWNGTNNIAVEIVLDGSGFFGALGGGLSIGDTVSGVGSIPGTDGINKGKFPIGPAPIATSTIDTDGSVFTGDDGIGGSPMDNGPFPDFNANFDFTSVTLDNVIPAPAVPVPAAVWLFGSGLLGLVGVARRRKV